MADQTKTVGPDGMPRRRARRLRVHLEGRLVGRQSHAVTVVDISLVGCLVQSPASLDKGTILDLEVELGAEKLLAKVRVRDGALDGDATAEGASLFLTGLEFLGLPARAEAQLRGFIDNESRRGRGADPTSR